MALGVCEGTLNCISLVELPIYTWTANAGGVQNLYSTAIFLTSAMQRTCRSPPPVSLLLAPLVTGRALPHSTPASHVSLPLNMSSQREASRFCWDEKPLFHRPVAITLPALPHPHCGHYCLTRWQQLERFVRTDAGQRHRQFASGGRLWSSAAPTGPESSGSPVWLRGGVRLNLRNSSFSGTSLGSFVTCDT